jgi:hypothetical protein
MFVISCDIQTDSIIQLVSCQMEYRKVYLPGQCSAILLRGGTPKIIVHIPRNPYVWNLLQDSRSWKRGAVLSPQASRLSDSIKRTQTQYILKRKLRRTKQWRICWRTEIIPVLPTTGQKLSRYFAGFFFCGETALLGIRPPNCWGFETTRRHTTFGRTPPDEGSARRRDVYLTKAKPTGERHTCPRRDSNPVILASERPKTHALERADTGIGISLDFNISVHLIYDILRSS